MQESERSLQRLATGLRDLATMKTDLSQCVAAGDSALLEQQLEQLHAEWEELCAKVRMVGWSGIDRMEYVDALLVVLHVDATENRL